MAKRRSDYDSPWKEIIELFFPQFMAFFFPGAHAAIDWNQPHEFLDKELQQVTRAAKSGRHTVDKLARVTLNDGTAALVLVHIEIQNQVDLVFPERMFIYGYRIYDRYKVRVVSLAILGDQDTTWRPQEFGYHLWGYEIKLRFPIIKLLDYEAEWAGLEQSRNPFAVVVMAHLRAKSTLRYPQTRLRWKIDLVKALYAKQFMRKEVVELFRFIDWVMALPEPFELQFERVLKELEEAEKMKYVTTIERRAIEKGLTQGIEQGIERGIEQGIERGIERGIEQGIEQGSLRTLREIVIEVLQLRFQNIPEELLAALAQLTDLQQLKQLHRQAIITSSLEEFEQMIETGEQD